MKTEQQIREEIGEIKRVYGHLLTGTLATIIENAPRALMQFEAETKLEILYWILGEKYESKLKRGRS